MAIFSAWFGRKRHSAPRSVPSPNEGSQPSQRNDPWFWSHYRDVAGVVRSIVPGEYFDKGRKVVDFGCGDGAATLGVAEAVHANVVGVDLFKTFLRLPDLARENAGLEVLPANLGFEQNVLGEALPFVSGSVDLIFSWSVFEHLADVNGTLREFGRITRPGGGVFIQIEPLFFAPFGSHLQRLVKEPWAHLTHGDQRFLEMAQTANDVVPENEKDMLYRSHAFEEVKRHLIREYEQLNRITADELAASVKDAGYRIEDERRISVEGHLPSPDLLARYPVDLLMTNQVVILAVKQ